MNSIAKKAKQALSSLVLAATILSSVGASLIAPLSASAALVDGTLIKAKEYDSVYYYKGGFRYTFPNQKIYKSWYKDFSTVQVIPLSELQSYSLKSPGGNVVYRPGTRLVKITTDPKVYAVEPGGKLRWVKDEATAKTLFGNDWAKRVDDVSDAFFTNYSIGADLQGATLPDGSIVKSGSTWFYIEGGKKRMVSEAAFAGNNFNAAYAVTADVSGYATGTDLGTNEFSDAAQGGSLVTLPTTPSGALTLSLASDTPAGTQSVVVDNSGELAGQRLARMTKVNFTANGGDVKVTKLTAKRLGVSKDADVDALYLADAAGKVLAKNLSFSNGAATFNGSLFTVPAGQTVSLWVLADINSAASAGSTQGWSVEAAGITTEGNGSVTGSAAGNLFTVASVSDLAQLEVDTSSPTSAATVDAGKTGYTLGTFKVKSVDQEMLVKSVKFTQIGTIATSDLQNLKLMIAGIQYGATSALSSDNTVTFDLSSHTDGGLKLLAGQTKFLDIVGDIVGGTNRTFSFSLQNQEDVVAWDSQYKVFVPVNAWNTNAFATKTLASTEINSGTLTTSLASDTPSTNIAVNATGVTVARFKVEAAGEDMKVSSLSLTSQSTSSTLMFKNVKLMLNGTQVGSTATTLQAAATNAYTFSNNFIVKTGTPSILEVVVDLTDSALVTYGTDQTFSFGLVAGSSNAQGLISMDLQSTTAVSGNTLTLKSGAPTVALNNALVAATAVNPSGVINDTDVKIGSFVIAAGAGEGAKITSLSLQDNTVEMGKLFSKMRIRGTVNGQYVDLAPEVGTLSNSTGSSYAFTLTNPVMLTKGQQFVLDVVANVLSTTSSDDLDTPAAVVKVKDASVAYQTVDTAQSGTITTGVTGQNVYIASKGTLTAAVSADTPVAQQLVLGALNQPLLKFKLTAGKSEDVSVTELTAAVGFLSSSTPLGLLQNVRLMEGDTTLGQPVASLTATSTYGGTATFNSLNVVVPKNTSKTYTVVADVAGTPDTLSALTFTARLSDAFLTSGSAVVAKGAKSGSSITASAAVSGQTMTAYKTKLTVAHAANAPTGAASKGTDQVVAKFVVSNSTNVNNQAATISAMDLAISTSISMGASPRNIKIYKTEQLNSNNLLDETALSLAADPIACVWGSAYAGSCSLFAFHEAFDSAVSIEAGTSQTFTVTADTNDAASNNTLTVGLAAGDILWTDGYTAGITSVNSLPLAGKTLTY